MNGASICSRFWSSETRRRTSKRTDGRRWTKRAGEDRGGRRLRRFLTGRNSKCSMTTGCEGEVRLNRARMHVYACGRCLNARQEEGRERLVKERA